MLASESGGWRHRTPKVLLAGLLLMGTASGAAPGASVERDQFRVSRRVPEAPAGLSVLLLDADVLARRDNLADVRIVDESSRQMPYIVERRNAPQVLALPVPARRAVGQSSLYRFDLPYAIWPDGTRFVVATDARTFERDVVLRRAADSHRNRRGRALHQTTWRSTDAGSPAPPLQFDLSVSRARSIEVVVDEGDNQPLPVTSARIELPTIGLRFHHPGKPLFLLYGNRRARQPRYDLELRAKEVLAAPARDLTLPRIASTRGNEEGRRDRWMFWIGIAVAAVVLMALLAKLLRSETSRAPNDTTSR
jgi:hypothetical protein